MRTQSGRLVEAMEERQEADLGPGDSCRDVDARSDGIDDETCEPRWRSDSSQSISISIW